MTTIQVSNTFQDELIKRKLFGRETIRRSYLGPDRGHKGIEIGHEKKIYK